jgi:1,4-dihydroxy-2-naphthoyl-CoA hydrolase
MFDKSTTLEQLNAVNKNTLMEQIGIEYLEVTEGYLRARMPVDNRTRQPMGLLHGGASLALAETVGSFGSALLVDLKKIDVRGAHMSANHIRSVKEGWVFAEARIMHRGRNTHVWNIDILDEEGQLVSSCRLTNFILPK